MVCLVSASDCSSSAWLGSSSIERRKNTGDFAAMDCGASVAREKSLSFSVVAMDQEGLSEESGAANGLERSGRDESDLAQGPSGMERVLFQISQKDQIDFNESKLKTYTSWEWPEAPHPAMPPGRPEHEESIIRMLRFSNAVKRFPRAFRTMLGRTSSEE